MFKFSEILKEERLRLGLTQDELAEKCGISKRAYNYYEKGERTPNVEFLTAFAEIGGDVVYLLTGNRNATKLSSLENMMLLSFNNLSDKQKLDAIGFMSGLKEPKNNEKLSQTVVGSVVQNMAGGNINIK